MVRLDQGWEFAHSLFAYWLICSFAQIAQIKWATVSDLLRLLRTNEQLWANCSGRSGQMSDHEPIAQVTHDKRATVSDSLSLLMINEWMSILLGFFANSSFALSLTKKWVIRSNFFWLKSYLWYVFCMFFLNERMAHSLFFNERCEQIAQVAHKKWAMWANRSGHSPKMSDVSKSLRSLTKNKRPWAIRSHRSEEMSDCERIRPTDPQQDCHFNLKKLFNFL